MRQRRHHRGDEPPGPVLRTRNVQLAARQRAQPRAGSHQGARRHPPQRPQEFKEADGAINHFRNFIQSVLGKEQVIAPPTVGQQAAISGHMATLSFKNQKKSIWDEAAQKVHFA